MTLVALLFPVGFALAACGMTWLLARMGWLAAARAAVLALAILTVWMVWDWYQAAGRDEMALLLASLLMLLPAVFGAIIGLMLGLRARRRRMP